MRFPFYLFSNLPCELFLLLRDIYIHEPQDVFRADFPSRFPGQKIETRVVFDDCGYVAPVTAPFRVCRIPHP